MKILAIDIGGTSIKAAIAGVSNALITLSNRHTTMVDNLDMKGSINIALDEYINYDFEAVAISATGIISDGTVIATNGKIGNYEGLNLKQLVNQKYDKQVVVCNDVNAIGYAEMPSLAEEKIHLVIALGTGIGGSLIYKNRLLTGSTGAFAEIGQLKINSNSFEELASTKALVVLAKEKYSLMIGNGLDFFKILNEDEKAKECFSEWLDNLALGLEQLLYMYNPNTIILAGAISNQCELIIPELYKCLSHLKPVYTHEVEIKAAKQYNDAGLLGAVQKLRSELC